MIKKKIKKKDNIINFPTKLSSIEKEIEGIVFAAAEPLDIETIENKISKKTDVEKILLKLQAEYSNRGINLVCISKKWSFRTSPNLSNLMIQEKTVEKKTIQSCNRNSCYNCLSSTSYSCRDRRNKRCSFWN